MTLYRPFIILIFGVLFVAPVSAQQINGCDFFNAGVEYDLPYDKGYHLTTVTFEGGETIQWDLSASGASGSSNNTVALISGGVVNLSDTVAPPNMAALSGNVVIPSAGLYEVRFYAYNTSASGPVSVNVTCRVEAVPTPVPTLSLWSLLLLSGLMPLMAAFVLRGRR